jgi:thioesterase domain-containing protein
MKSSHHDSANCSLVCLQEGATTPLFCIHPVGGTVFCYAELVRDLGPKQPVYGFQSRGLGVADEPLTSVAEMASAYLDLMRGVQPDGPYYLGGWSLGGIIALEMAQQLHSLGMRTALLALIDSHLPRSNAKPGLTLSNQPDETQLLISFALGLGIPGARLRKAESFLTDLRMSNIGEVLRLAWQNGLLPDDVDYERAQRLFKVFKANHHAIWRYVPRPYAGKITYFSAQNQRPDTRAGLGVWNSLARGGIEYHVIPGDHYAIVKAPNSELLAKELRRCISQAQAATAVSIR